MNNLVKDLKILSFLVIFQCLKLVESFQKKRIYDKETYFCFLSTLFTNAQFLSALFIILVSLRTTLFGEKNTCFRYVYALVV